MLFNKNKNKNKKESAVIKPIKPVIEDVKDVKDVKQNNPRISLEFLPDGNVKPVVFWEAHTNFNAVLMANVLNLLNQGKLYEYFKQAIADQGEKTGDIELARVILNNIKNPKSIEDEKPIIPASMVTRLHFSQQKINSVVEE